MNDLYEEKSNIHLVEMELINDSFLINLIEEDYLHTLSLYGWNISSNNHYEYDQIFSHTQSPTKTIASTGSFFILVNQK